MVGSCHRIGQTLLARGQAEGHDVEQLAMEGRRKRRLRNERAPGDVADVGRHELRQALLADCGTKAVRTHQQLALCRAAVGKLREHRSFALHEAADAAAAVVVLARKRVTQQPVDALPSRQNLRTRELASHPTRRIEDFPGGDLDPEIGRIDAEPAQRLDQIGLRDNAGAAPCELALDPLEDVDVPAGAPQQQRSQEAAHRAADDQHAPPRCLAHSARSCRFPPRKSWYISGQTWRNAMALTMLDKQPETAVKSAWPPEIAAEFEREKNNPNPCVGNALVSESDRVRVWTIRLKPGERIG